MTSFCYRMLLSCTVRWCAAAAEEFWWFSILKQCTSCSCLADREIQYAVHLCPCGWLWRQGQACLSLRNIHFTNTSLLTLLSCLKRLSHTEFAICGFWTCSAGNVSSYLSWSDQKNSIYVDNRIARRLLLLQSVLLFRARLWLGMMRYAFCADLDRSICANCHSSIFLWTHDDSIAGNQKELCCYIGKQPLK